jgi:hypothetical protein
VTATDAGDAGVATDGTSVDRNVPARCCAIWTTYAHPEIPQMCARMAPDAGADTRATTEPCWDSNAAGNYARWTCGGADGGGQWCSANGESCNVGDNCYLPDIGCPGTVQDCAYRWYP